MKTDILTSSTFCLPTIQRDEFGMPFFEIAHGVKGELPPHFDANHMSESEWFSFILGTAVSIPCNLIASYFYDLLKDKKAVKIVVNGVTLEGDKQEIEEMLKNVIGAP